MTVNPSAPTPGRFVCAMLSPFISLEEKSALLAVHDDSMEVEAISRFLQSHRLEAYAYHALKAIDSDSKLGSALKDACRSAASKCSIGAAIHLSTLAKLLELARQNGIQLIVFKGPAIVEQIHEGDYGRRPFSDIDLAILRNEVARFLSLVMSEFHGRSRFQFEHAMSRLHLQIDKSVFEVHWDLALFYSFNRSTRRAERQSQLWNRSVSCVGKWGEYQSFDPLDMVVHQAAHAVLQHDLNAHALFLALDFSISLQRLQDAKPPVSADELNRIAEGQGYPLALQAMAIAAVHSFPGSHDCLLLTQLAESAPRELERYVAAEINALIECNEKPMPRDIRDMVLAMAHFMDGGDNRIRFSRQAFFPSRFAMSETLKRELTPSAYMLGLLYHALRWPGLLPALRTLLRNQLRESAQGTCRRRGVSHT